MIPLWESRGLIGSLLDLFYEILARFVLAVTETGMVPDVVLRRGMKLLCWLRLKELQQPSVEMQQKRLTVRLQVAEDSVNSVILHALRGEEGILLRSPPVRSESVTRFGRRHSSSAMEFVSDLRRRPVAEQLHAPNQQHYEIPTEFYLFCLGRHMNYSTGLYRDFDPRIGLDNAEASMLALCCERARLGDGQNVLDLGCGWGSLSLHLAASFPKSKITAVSSSKTQKEYIETRAKERALRNLTVIVADMSTFVPPAAGSYDRIVSVDLLCHLKNYDVFLGRAARWLAPDGLLFMQTVAHRAWPYHFEPRGEDDWVARHFATGATMPSEGLLLHFQESAVVEEQWALSGLHAALTAEDWLRNFDRNRPTITMIFERTYGEQFRKWLVYWRLFFLACAETFAYNGGEEWYTAQYLLRRSKGGSGSPPELPSLSPL